MKKLVVLVGVAAAAYGALKLIKGKDEESQTYAGSQAGPNGYAPNA